MGAGDLVFIPPATDHAIVNDGEETLVYVSAAAPPVSMEELYEVQLAADVRVRGRHLAARRLLPGAFFF